METLKVRVSGDSLHPKLLTSSEVELMETFRLILLAGKSMLLLTSSEVELMETYRLLL